MRRAYKVGIAGAAGLVAIYGLQYVLGSDYGHLADLTIVTMAAIAVASSGVAMLRYERGSQTQSGRIWPSLTLGLFLWFLGELTFSVYFEVLNVPIPYPSMADGFYLAGYFPLFVGLYYYISYFHNLYTTPILAATAVAMIVAGVLVAALLVVPVTQETADPLARFFDFAYPLLDLLLLSVAMLGLSLLVKGSIGPVWTFVNVAIALNVVADMLYSYMTAVGTYYLGSFPDLLYMMAYLSFALAFYLHRKDL